MCAHRWKQIACCVVVVAAPAVANADGLDEQSPAVIVTGPAPTWMDVEIWVHDAFFSWTELPFVAKSSAPCSAAVTTRIAGEFGGFDGDRVFQLANGQLWRQVSNELSQAYKHSPEALVYWSDGMCKLKVTGMDQQVVVERLE